MSREIKFRGQTRRKGERVISMAGDKCEANWVYGGIFPQNNGGDFSIIYEQPSCEKRVVYADTVGQYIGVPDKNGKEIYEKDIVLIDGEDEYFVVEWDNDTARFVMTSETMTVDFDNYWGYQVEVIGNVYENTDLLKGVDRNEVD